MYSNLIEEFIKYIVETLKNEGVIFNNKEEEKKFKNFLETEIQNIIKPKGTNNVINTPTILQYQYNRNNIDINIQQLCIEFLTSNIDIIKKIVLDFEKDFMGQKIKLDNSSTIHITCFDILTECAHLFGLPANDFFIKIYNEITLKDFLSSKYKIDKNKIDDTFINEFLIAIKKYPHGNCFKHNSNTYYIDSFFNFKIKSEIDSQLTKDSNMKIVKTNTNIKFIKDYIKKELKKSINDKVATNIIDKINEYPNKRSFTIDGTTYYLSEFFNHILKDQPLIQLYNNEIVNILTNTYKIEIEKIDAELINTFIEVIEKYPDKNVFKHDNKTYSVDKLFNYQDKNGANLLKVISEKVNNFMEKSKSFNTFNEFNTESSIITTELCKIIDDNYDSLNYAMKRKISNLLALTIENIKKTKNTRYSQDAIIYEQVCKNEDINQYLMKIYFNLKFTNNTVINIDNKKIKLEDIFKEKEILIKCLEEKELFELIFGKLEKSTHTKILEHVKSLLTDEIISDLKNIIDKKAKITKIFQFSSKDTALIFNVSEEIKYKMYIQDQKVKIKNLKTNEEIDQNSSEYMGCIFALNVLNKEPNLPDKVKDLINNINIVINSNNNNDIEFTIKKYMLKRMQEEENLKDEDIEALDEEYTIEEIKEDYPLFQEDPILKSLEDLNGTCIESNSYSIGTSFEVIFITLFLNNIIKITNELNSNIDDNTKKKLFEEYKETFQLIGIDNANIISDNIFDNVLNILESNERNFQNFYNRYRNIFNSKMIKRSIPNIKKLIIEQIKNNDYSETIKNEDALEAFANRYLESKYSYSLYIKLFKIYFEIKQKYKNTDIPDELYDVFNKIKNLLMYEYDYEFLDTLVGKKATIDKDISKTLLANKTIYNINDNNIIDRVLLFLDLIKKYDLNNNNLNPNFVKILYKLDIIQNLPLICYSNISFQLDKVGDKYSDWVNNLALYFKIGQKTLLLLLQQPSMQAFNTREEQQTSHPLSLINTTPNITMRNKTNCKIISFEHKDSTIANTLIKFFNNLSKKNTNVPTDTDEDQDELQKGGIKK